MKSVEELPNRNCFGINSVICLCAMVKPYGELLQLKALSTIKRAVRCCYGGPVPRTGPLVIV